MESVWFYVLCFYIWKMFGKFMLVPGTTRGTFNYTEETHCIRRNSIQKTTEKNSEAFTNTILQKKEQMQQHLLLVVSIFSNVKQFIKGYLQIRKHNQL